MSKLILTYLGKDFWDRPVYKDEKDRFFKDVNLGIGVLDLCTSSCFDGEPITPVCYIESLKSVEIEITNPPQIESRENKFNYMMLDRLKMDCEYFLGYGKRNIKNLWADNAIEHIEEMKRIYNTLNKKPKWLIMKQIEKYETEMKEF